MDIVKVEFCWLAEDNSDLQMPYYASAGAAGADVLAAVQTELVLAPGARVLVPTGFALAIPEGYEVQVRPRSGLASKYGITVVNAPGTIDSDYRGEVKIALVNLGCEEFTIQRGERIAQLVLAPVVQAQWAICQELSETERGTGGFGHTGR